MLPEQVKIYQWYKFIFGLVGLGIISASIFFTLLFLHGALLWFTSNKYQDSKAEGKNYMIRAFKGLIIVLIIWLITIILGEKIMGPFIPPIILPLIHYL